MSGRVWSIKDSVVTDICSPQERVVQGKTLFALLNPQGPDQPHQGSVCTCLAESTKWPTINSIAAFIVDMRLNRVGSEQCANTSMTVRSGSNQKTLTCATSRDPRVNFPFVAVLNDSNVASLRLQLDRHLPEFIWLGFEANEEEDIRLSCKLQGVQPTRPNNGRGPPRPNNGNGKATPPPAPPPEVPLEENGESGLPLAAIIGGAVAGILAIIILVIIIIILIRKKKPAVGLPEVDEEESELDLYYSTTANELRKRDASRHEKRPSKCSTDSRQELYITADQVRANKRGTSSKRVRIVSTPDIVEDLGPQQYVSRAQIRENKRQSQKKKQPKPDFEISDPFPTPHGMSTGRNVITDEEEDDDHYDRLHGPQKNMAAILESYDQLEPGEKSDHQPTYSSAEITGQSSGSTRPMVKPGTTRGGNENQAYETTDIKQSQAEHKSLFRISLASSKEPTEDRDVYFELEKDKTSRHSITSVSTVSDMCMESTVEASAPPLAEERSKAPGEYEEEEIYNDGRSEFSAPQLRTSVSSLPTPQASPSSKPKKRLRTSAASIGSATTPTAPPATPGTPVAAPRRKPSLGPVHSSSANYDLAKPIP
ncbi:hypothetical protein EGW08_010929 [Elysia chlorotica]|uniref:Uncharacterized protein n=1 Tax=Elysia chlorotica TaxID=188477 RepID=A0A3S1B701_ELYCH|nr:hypothetical protein EGW08_010929 [Elysia chlorotica]